ncbi:replication initiation protein [Paraflavisolibacter sp. H34]|uniref:replication initiation protein n=1 Tax=Huijunlia imazamoxiresistens TaxID=3127457 RepID=UPI0030166E27
MEGKPLEEGKVVLKTAKRKKEVVLPELREIVFIPNRVTNAQYDYTLIQEKIFNYVMYYLQEAILLNMNGGDYTQLELFKVVDTHIKVRIPLKNIAIPAQYKDVRNSAKQLASIVVGVPYRDKDSGKSYTRYQGLFKVSVPDELVRSSDLIIEIEKEIAKVLVELELNQAGKPKNYTSFVLQIATQSKNKYTSRLYKKISSWKEKGGFYMSLDEFRDWLQLGDKYPTYYDLKKNILIPVQKELEGKAPCWFNCKEKSFEKREGKTVVGLHFKVITPDLVQAKRIHADNIINMLRLHCGFKDQDIQLLTPIFNDSFDHSRVINKIMELNEHIRENRATINSPKNYMLKSLLKEFAPE